MLRQLADLETVSNEFSESSKKIKHRVIICAGTGCVANGSLKVYEALGAEIKNKGLKVSLELKREEEDNKDVFISKSGCQGFCQMGPLLTILPENIFYTRVKTADVPEIVQQTLVEGKVVERLLYREPASGNTCLTTEDIPFYQKQHRFVLKECGSIDPEDIREYIQRQGYRAALKSLSMKPEDICEEIISSGLRGRGGAGFPTGKKWAITLRQKNAKKYVICNGDEGDPGAFMDRSVMEGNPHSVLEGMMIAARAIGADEGYVYVRAEYPLAVRRMRKAVDDARNDGLLGENIFGSGFNFNVEVMEGAGAFVCGEETALIASIEGKRGMPSPKPPFPAQSGLRGKPTVINNVETLATVPLVMRMGAVEYRKMGTAGSPGTKTFALTGHVANTGLIEVPFGSTLRQIVYQIAGGVTNADGSLSDKPFKAVQIGGPSGGCLVQEHLDIPMDFDSLRKAGAMVGSGGLVVMNSGTCMVAIARFFMQFTQNESCGKCVLCREGTKQMLALLDDIIEGRATEETLIVLEDLAKAVQVGSLCGLGKTAPNPVLSTLRYFRQEYLAHVKDKYCPAGQCKALAKYRIDPALCKGCTLCARKCPVGAIKGERGKAHVIDEKLCIKCGACAAACKFNAISGGVR
ncbi:MAG: NADH-quinone oxidoreductase subunit NuoF [Candidatus Omnitrophica bacterium]|nr:NADH-quinone oxidoreductase subunit NuoF [Candidatus Omnitrophota bacterium]